MAKIGRAALLALLVAALAAGCATRAPKAEPPVPAEPALAAEPIPATPETGVEPSPSQAEEAAAAEEEAAARAEKAAREAAREAARQAAAKEEADRAQVAREEAAKELAAKEQAAKEQAAKELAAKEQAAKELAAKEQAAKELAAKQLAAKEAASRQAKKEAAPEPRTSFAPMPRERRLGYLDEALAGFLSERLENGAAIAVVERPHAAMAAARIELAPPSRGGPGSEGLDRLALSYATMGRLEAALRAARGRMSIEIGESDALVLECPPEEMPALLSAAGSCLSAPSFSAADFDRALREAGIGARRDSGDAQSRSSAEIRSWLYGGERGLPSRGSPSALRARTRDEVLRYWNALYAPERMTVAVSGVGDALAAEGALRAWLGGLPRRGPAPNSERPSPGAVSRTIPLSSLAGSVLLRVEFAEPPASSRDSAAMAVCLAMLQDLVEDRAGLRAFPSSASSLSSGLLVRALVGPAPTLVGPAPTLVGPDVPMNAVQAAIGGLGEAIAALASGRCSSRGLGGRLLQPGSDTVPLAERLDAYESRVIVAASSRAAAGQAALVARDLAAGGDGAGIFRLAGLIRGLRPEDVERVARERLAGGAAAWIALCDPALSCLVERELSARTAVGGLFAPSDASRP